MDSDRVPVTVLTGFLGAGKTTLVNRILTGKHGWKIAVLENEFGDVPVDSELVVATEEDLIVFNNGCVCCTFRGDLLRALHDLLRRPGTFDAILVETTGVADPSPVVQSFFVDDDLKDKVALDAVVTLVDAKHAGPRLDDAPEARSQVVYGDVILLNKTDLVDAAALDALEARVRELNPMARIHRTTNAEIDLAKVLGVGAFDLSRKLELAPPPEGERHSKELRAVTVREAAPLDGKKFNAWLGRLLMNRGQDLFRMKGFAHVAGEARRVVFQGVHMLFEGRPDKPWPEGDPRETVIVFIGRALDEAELREGLASCRAD